MCVCVCLTVCDLETSTSRRPRPELRYCATENKWVSQRSLVFRFTKEHIKLVHEAFPPQFIQFGDPQILLPFTAVYNEILEIRVRRKIKYTNKQNTLNIRSDINVKILSNMRN